MMLTATILSLFSLAVLSAHASYILSDRACSSLYITEQCPPAYRPARVTTPASVEKAKRFLTQCRVNKAWIGAWLDVDLPKPMFAISSAGKVSVPDNVTVKYHVLCEETLPTHDYEEIIASEQDNGGVPVHTREEYLMLQRLADSRGQQRVIVTPAENQFTPEIVSFEEFGSGENGHVVTFVTWPVRGKEMDEQEPVVLSDDNTSRSAGTDSDGDEEHFSDDDEVISDSE
jgi:hypothetical protein